MDKLTYTLATPVQFTASRLVEELRFRSELKAGDLERLDRAEGRIGGTFQILAALLGNPSN